MQNLTFRYTRRVAPWYSVFLATIRSPLHGRNGFVASRVSNCAAKTTFRDIFTVDLQWQECLVTIDIKGVGILRSMVLRPSRHRLTDCV